MTVTIKAKQPAPMPSITEPQFFTLAQIQALGDAAPPRLSTDELCKKVKMGKSSLYNYINAGRFPQPDIRVRNTVACSLIIVEEWMQSHPDGLRYKKVVPV